MPKARDITGQRFGRLVAIRRAGRNKSRQTLWLCRCDCGGEKIASIGDLSKGCVASCDCLRRDVATATLQVIGQHGSICRICGGNIPASPGRHRTLCSDECKAEAEKRRRKEAWAKMTAEQRAAHNARVCAAQKRKFSGARVCGQCGKTFRGPAKRKYCSPECLQLHRKSGEYRYRHRANTAATDLARIAGELNERTDDAK